MNAGKGDSPRDNFSQKFRDNYEAIDFNHAITCARCGAMILDPERPERQIPDATGDVVFVCSAHELSAD